MVTRILGKVVKATKKAATTTAQQKVKREAGVDTRFSKKGFKQYMDTVDRNAFDKEMQTKLAKRAAKKGMTKKEASAMASDELKKLQKAKKVDKRTDTVVKGVRKARDEVRAADKAKRTSKKGTQGTGFRFATKKSTSEVAAGRENARTGGDDTFAFQQEYGRGGKEKITEGKRACPRMEEAASKGSRKRAKTKVEAERKAREGDTKAAAKVKRMDKQSAKAEAARIRKSAVSRSESARKDKGVSLAGMDGKMTVGAKPKFKDSDMMVGNTKNGVTKDGEVVGNPTDNQIAAVVRNLEARQKLSAEAKRNLTRLKRMTKTQRQDRAISRLNKNIRDTGPDRKNKGGLMKSVHTDMRKSGLFR